MNEDYSNEQVEQYLSKVNEDIEKGRITSEDLRNDFTFHQARIDGIELDLCKEQIRMDISPVDWLKENTGSVNPYLPHRLIFHDMVQIYYRSREERKETRIFDLQAQPFSERLIEAKDLYAHRVEAGGKPIGLDIQMPLEDTELIILCSELEIFVGDRVVVVAPPDSSTELTK
jgi:hypothetical protein